jgi:hypothetical protein
LSDGQSWGTARQIAIGILVTGIGGLILFLLTHSSDSKDGGDQTASSVGGQPTSSTANGNPSKVTSPSAWARTWGPQESVAGSIDFDAPVPDNSASGADADVRAGNFGNSGDEPEDYYLIVGNLGAKLALWDSSRSLPSAQQCSDLTSAQSSTTGDVRVKLGSVVCVATDQGRVVIIRVTGLAHLTQYGNEPPDITVDATVFTPS